MSKIFGQALLDDMVRKDSLPMPLVKQAAKEILVVIREGLRRDGVVKISNFGTFRLKPIAARQGINPQTGKAITIPAQQRVIFSPCKALRDLIQPIYQPPQPIDTETDSDSSPLPEDSPVEVQVTSPSHHTVEPSHGTVKGSDDASPAAAPSSPAPSRLVTSHEITEKLATTIVPDQTFVPQEAAIAPEPEPESVPSASTGMPEAATVVSPLDVPEESANESPLETLVIQSPKVSLAETPIPSESSPAATADAPAQGGGSNKEMAPENSTKRYTLSAAMILLITLVAASLLLESETDLNNAPQETVAAKVTPPAKSVAPSTTVTTDDEINTTPSQDVTNPPGVHAGSDNNDMPGSATLTTMSVNEDTVGTVAARNEGEVVPQDKASVSGLEFESPEPVRAAEYFFIEQSHDIANGESLWRLARHHYQDPLLWPHIYQANIDVVDNPDHLLVGSTITVPGLQGPPDRLTKRDRQQVAEGYYLAYLHYKKIGREDAVFALLEAKRYDNSVVEKYRSRMQLSKAEELQLAVQQTMPF